MKIERVPAVPAVQAVQAPSCVLPRVRGEERDRDAASMERTTWNGLNVSNGLNGLNGLNRLNGWNDFNR